MELTTLPVLTPSESLAEPEAGPTAEQIDAYFGAVRAAEWDAAAAYAITVGYWFAVSSASAAATAPRAAPVPIRSSAPVSVQQAPTGAAPGGFLACVRNRESRGNYGAVNSSSGASGAYQFMPGTWANMHTGYPSAASAPAAVQDAAAARLYASAGRSPWAGPGC